MLSGNTLFFFFIPFEKQLKLWRGNPWFVRMIWELWLTCQNTCHMVVFTIFRTAQRNSRARWSWRVPRVCSKPHGTSKTTCCELSWRKLFERLAHDSRGHSFNWSISWGSYYLYSTTACRTNSKSIFRKPQDCGGIFNAFHTVQTWILSWQSSVYNRTNLRKCCKTNGETIWKSRTNKKVFRQKAEIWL